MTRVEIRDAPLAGRYRLVLIGARGEEMFTGAPGVLSEVRRAAELIAQAHECAVLNRVKDRAWGYKR